jgi:hypothetical protein
MGGRMDMKTKKIIAMGLAAAMTAGMLAGCGSKNRRHGITGSRKHDICSNFNAGSRGNKYSRTDISGSFFNSCGRGNIYCG